MEEKVNETATKVEEKVNETAKKTEEKAKEQPGLEGILAITGLLAVAYLVLGRRE